MNRYEMLEVERAIEACRNGRLPVRSKPKSKPWRPHRVQFDKIISLLCLGCGKTLGRYEINNHLSWCLNCRRFLYPDTVGRFDEKKVYSSKRRY